MMNIIIRVKANESTVIGAGSIEKRHAINFKIPNHEVVVCDPMNLELSNFQRKQFKYYFDYSEEIDCENFNAGVMQP